eukprot:GHVR01075704.1.p1 GENE.GHVR01075704.1~~GHVR01075704.1.p1  ORF type:complete len:272 (-),score=94.07 GHVR01075704.1:305-1015(-)
MSLLCDTLSHILLLQTLLEAFGIADRCDFVLDLQYDSDDNEIFDQSIRFKARGTSNSINFPLAVGGRLDSLIAKFAHRDDPQKNISSTDSLACVGVEFPLHRLVSMVCADRQRVSHHSKGKKKDSYASPDTGDTGTLQAAVSNASVPSVLVVLQRTELLPEALSLSQSLRRCGVKTDVRVGAVVNFADALDAPRDSQIYTTFVVAVRSSGGNQHVCKYCVRQCVWHINDPGGGGKV